MIGDCPNCELVKPENSVRNFATPAEIVALAMKASVLGRHDSVLEAGSGCLRNARYLQKKGFKVSVVETKLVVERYHREYARFMAQGGTVYQHFPRKLFDVVLSTFTIECMCPSPRTRFLGALNRAVRRGGVLIVAVRGASDFEPISKNMKKCPANGDGYLTPIRTFTRVFTNTEVIELLERFGFEVRTGRLQTSKPEPRVNNFIVVKRNSR